jgi:DNA-binding response OmpR family regulator
MRILVLEDDPFIAGDLQAILEGEGHEVVGVFSSLSGASENLGADIDYALLDIDVVGGKSFGIASTLAEKRIPFAFVSASHPADIPHSLREFAFIPKPFEERAILQSINQSPSARYTSA